MHTMAYVVYNVNTTAIVTERAYGTQYYKTEAAAKAAKTRICRKKNLEDTVLAVQDSAAYHLLIAGTREVINLMSGEKVLESVNTPWHCSVASESYWAN
jgi:hypothetical protein